MYGSTTTQDIADELREIAGRLENAEQLSDDQLIDAIIDRNLQDSLVKQWPTTVATALIDYDPETVRSELKSAGELPGSPDLSDELYQLRNIAEQLGNLRYEQLEDVVTVLDDLQTDLFRAADSIESELED